MLIVQNAQVVDFEQYHFFYHDLDVQQHCLAIFQFLVQTTSLSGGCSDRPIFVNNTPPEGTIFHALTGQTTHINFYVASNQTYAVLI